MNSLLSQITSYSASTLLKSARITARSSIYGCSSNLHERKRLNYPSLGSFVSSRIGVVWCYSTKKSSSRKKKSSSETAVEEEKDAFYVVRKGDIVGVYKSLSECQAQVSSSICDPPVSVFKGYSFPKNAEEYLHSRGLQNALYTITASDLNDEIFGKLMLCPLQEPSSKGEASSTDSPQKIPDDMSGTENVVGSNGRQNTSP